jgi:hypothetical protein
MAALLTSYDVESGVRSTFKTGFNASTTTGLIIKRALNITSGVLLINRAGATQEWISFNSTTVNGDETTLGDVVRGLALSGNVFTGSPTRAFAHGSGEIVELVDYHILLNLKANIDRTNTFSAGQTMGGQNKLFFNDSATYIYYNGADLVFKSPLQAEIGLSTIANGAGINDKTKVSATDTTSDYLNPKISVANSGLAKTILNPAGNEVLALSVQLEASNPSLQVSAGELGLKIKPAGGLAKDADGTYVDGSAIPNVTAVDLATTFTYNEGITLGNAVSIDGIGRVVQSNADSLNETFLFTGIAKATGVQGDSRQVAIPGPIVTISTTLTAAGGRQWPGQSNATSNTTTDEVYGTNRRSQGFTPAAGEINVKSVVLNLTSVGSPTGTYTLAIYATTAGLPTGPALATTTLAASAMATGNNTFTFSSALTVTPLTVYALVLSNATALVSNNFKWNYQNSGNPYAGGMRGTSSDSGVNWSGDTNADYRFIINYESLYGEPVYLSTTDGAFTLTPPSNSTQYVQRVGWALSPTQIVLNPGMKFIYATYQYTVTAAGTTDTTLTIGFRPMMIFAKLSDGDTGSMGMWMNANAHTGFSLENKGDFGMVNAQTGLFGEGTVALLYRNGLQNSTSGTPANRSVQTLTVQGTGADSVTIRRVVTITGTPSDPTTIDLLILGL